jgi:hypothetical protein
VDPHELAEERSLALHALIAARIQGDREVAAAARARVAQWQRDGSVHPSYANAWMSLLDGPTPQLIAMLVDRGERGRALRQCTPFAGVIDPRTRWRVWREVRERLAG